MANQSSAPKMTYFLTLGSSSAASRCTLNCSEFSNTAEPSGEGTCRFLSVFYCSKAWECKVMTDCCGACCSNLCSIRSSCPVVGIANVPGRVATSVVLDAIEQNAKVKASPCDAFCSSRNGSSNSFCCHINALSNLPTETRASKHGWSLGFCCG